MVQLIRLFVYPFKGVGAVTMTDDDVSRLSDGEFLNDNIIEFYLKWYFDQLKEKNPSLADKVHIFNSFFYKRLTQKAKSNKNEDSYDRVKKWTAKVDLFSKQYIFMPVNESLHWYLVLICNHDLMLPQNSRKNPIDLDAEVTIPPITTTDPLNSQTILADKDLVMEQATVRRSPSSRNMHRVPTDDLIQKISASKSETGSNECGEIIIGKAPVAPVDCEPENDKVSQINGYNLKDSNTLRIEPDDMDIDTSSSPRVVSCETPEVVIFSPPKSKKRVNGNPAHKPPHIVIEDSQPDEQGERHQPRISTRGRTLITNKSGPIVVKASLSPEPKRPRFDEDDVKFPTLEDVGKKTKRSVSPPLTSGLKKGKDKEKEFVDPNRGPWIIILDSLGSKHPTVSKTIKKYLTSEAKEKRKVDVNLEMLTCIYAKVPKQTNHCDCGVYLLHYVEKFLGDPEKYLQLLVNKEDNKQAWSPSEIHSKREYIRNVIHTTADIYQIEMVKEKSLQEK
ncbi:hypothetical protein BC937DRAFT_92464 [Endogone sp. FLAS-F59071]|nr:hypothetical protein BC937DRAFT_92464 [Endogone sp. FLAS-F59071]|eukprot:RUS15424.1 hypothetical protein BC937DRAFT_92464 [Endogone sp. FLAS-F59071]